ncbi:hypothetical protein Tsubulata_046365 [Turnera subulata]|uniref:Uncharacterized protein n=1 Tax=Turnera subulata TaxID=218843 RepID=A0A9Q0F725_9ROSI|nr:hypothetical protein Tsubulata_046365 [Turnera subulata]
MAYFSYNNYSHHGGEYPLSPYNCGYDSAEYSLTPYNSSGYDSAEYSGTPYSSSGYDSAGYSVTPYASSGYNSEYSVTPYCSSGYDPAQLHDSAVYSSYKCNDPNPFFAAYDGSFQSFSTIAYSASAVSGPMCIEYDPGTYDHSKTRISVFYSVSEFNEPEFEEYDPTPYGGGYDIAQTYGKPLPPSDETCYPKGLHLSEGTALTRKDEAVDEQAGKLPTESNLLPVPVQEADKQHQEVQGNGHGNLEEKALALYQGEESKGNDDCQPLSGHDSTCGNGQQDYEYSNSVSQIPPGYGLEAMDLCESLFGYWPCLSRNGRRGNGFHGVTDHGTYGNQWKATADYLFGSTNPYDDEK